jgi:hypothetical protein
MEIQEDFKELLALFNSHKVKYLIVGSYALAFHGSPRYTGDIDIYIKPDSENAQRVMTALEEFGFGSVGLSEKDFKSCNQVIQLGVPPVRIDILTSITGVSWEDAVKDRVKGRYGDISAYFIGQKQFILNKKALGRKKDIADIEAISER